MDKALDPSAYIYEGYWINWSKGRILGPTTTLSPTRATLVTNVLALFVTIAGGQAWTIVRFTLHQIRTFESYCKFSQRYNKEQVIRRNSTSAITAAQLLLYLGWTSRKSTADPVSKPSSTPIFVLAIFITVFFLVAGAFSNTLTDAGPWVLSRSPRCGFFNQTYANIVYAPDTANPETFEMYDESFAKRTQNVELSLQYAQSCYLMQGTGSSNCDTFKQSSLEFTASENGTCPFDPRMCQSKTAVFDTGLIDSHADPGINSRAADRIAYRRVTNCTVLNDTSHTTGWISQANSSGAQPAWSIAYAFFGPDLTYSENATYTHSNSAEFDTGYDLDYSIPYQMGYNLAYTLSDSPDPSSSTFEPMPELKQDKADLSLLYLSFSGTYIEPVEDPWFAAHQIAHINITVPFLQTTYARDRPISTVGCTQQHQICAASMDCTPLLGFDQVQMYQLANIPLTESQNITLDRIISAAGDAEMFEIMQNLGSVSTPFLAINKTLKGRNKIVSLPLPDDQWISELQYWQSISLAQLQRVVVEYGTGQISPQLKYLLPPETDAQKWICQNLIIRSTVYS